MLLCSVLWSEYTLITDSLSSSVKFLFQLMGTGIVAGVVALETLQMMEGTL